MANIDEMIKAREDYIALIKSELLGPGSEIKIPDIEHELISSSPLERYSVGVLFPKGNKTNADSNDVFSMVESDEDLSPEDLEQEIEAFSIEKPNAFAFAEEDNLDEEIGMASQNMPSSMGITFLANGESKAVNVDVSFATYREASFEDCAVPLVTRNPDEYCVPEQLSNYIKYDSSNRCVRLCRKVDFKEIRYLQEMDIIDYDEYNLFDIMCKLVNQVRKGYVRVPHNFTLTVNFGESDYAEENCIIDNMSAKLTALRRRIDDNLCSITIMLVNDNECKARADKCIFQPEIKVLTENNSFVFRDYSYANDIMNADEEEKSLALQYRHKKVYGTGLGTSVNWNIDESGNGKLFNDYFPNVEVPQMDFGLPECSEVAPDTLSMKYLSDLNDIPRNEKISNLRSFISEYKSWIDNLKEKANTLDERFTDVAQINIAGCEKACNRMIDGIELLASDDKIWDAFVLANRAMFMQRVHLKLQNATSQIDRYPYDEELCDILDDLEYKNNTGFTADVHNWRPFQLAFILMSIRGITKDDSDDRELVDLIWFPTGGGKTEAYLGLTAFTIFYRRLNHLDISSGTAVIMRYTLRLLAAQQFTRASTLICACEYIREDCALRRPKYKSYPLGKDRITIGLWIGGEHTPNTNQKASDCLEKLSESDKSTLKYNKDKYNKFQVLKCPWCGTKLVRDVKDKTMTGVFGYKMKNNKHFRLFCPQESCHFNQDNLPIQIVDEELYINPPTLLFGTVDKFAMLPWKQEIGNFFGMINNNRTPELIIQDELHLISGPLGTMVGLYETAIDALCRSKGVKTKIVASTATIRRAKEQCSALYDREVSQFPHPGLDAEDSFFAKEKTIDHTNNQYGRLYIGLMPSGKTKAMMEIRSISALLQKIYEMPLPDEIKDKYWTLTVYFNSLKDLGKASTLVDDDVKDSIRRTAYRLGSSHNVRYIYGADELTSRVSTTALNETLDKLEKLVYSKENIENKRYASDVLLATNMISVGIDVARLNVMLLVGQPKLTSEYIQASSRVGRSFPGVAIALYDGSKSRDRSHYEQFKSYHESFYKFVEPTGATPFSKPACERALHAVVISLMRHLVPSLSSEQGAAMFSIEDYSDIITEIKNFITERDISIVNRINKSMEANTEEIIELIERMLDEWQRLAENYDNDNFEYGNKYLVRTPENGKGRLMKVFNTEQGDPAFNTMTSMRNVDSMVTGNVLVWED